MGLPITALPRSSYVPPIGGASTLLGGDPNIVRVADPSPSEPAASQRTAVTRNLPGVGMTFLDSEFAPKIDAFRQYARDQGVDLQFTDAYRTPEHQKYLNDNWRTLLGMAYPPAERSYYSAGLAVDVDYRGDSEPTRSKIILDAARRAGLNWGGSFGDNVHFDFRPTGNLDSLIDNFTKQISVKDAPP
jgi:hypothetical protein